MLSDILRELGPWNWWVVGMILLAAEIVVPGVFLVWIGLGALLTGALSLLLVEQGFWVWQLQMVFFALSSVVFVLLGRRYFYRNDRPSDEPFLNHRGESLVGRTALLADPIVEGRGRIRLDDTWWIVTGPDLPMGARVRVVASHGRDLRVEELAP